jgi:hypothetical protein
MAEVRQHCDITVVELGNRAKKYRPEELQNQETSSIAKQNFRNISLMT